MFWVDNRAPRLLEYSIVLQRSLLPLVLACFLVANHQALAVDKDELRTLLESSAELEELNSELEELEARIKAKEGDRREQTKARTELRRRVGEAKKQLSKRSKACTDWFKATGGKDINAQDDKGRSLLMLVAASGNEEAIDLVLADNPKLDLIDRHGKSALDYERDAKQGTTLQTHMEALWMKAFADSDTATISMLLEAGLPADTTAGDEPAPVLALKLGNAEVLGMLLGHSATIKARSKDGLDLLELAISSDNAKAISMLCAAGMGKERLSNGNTALFHLLTHGRADCLKAFLDSCTALDDATRRAIPSMVARYGTAEMVGERITEASIANAEDGNGNIPVHEAARRGDIAILRLVLERGGNRTATNGAGESTLMHAALSGNPEAVALVLEGLSPKDINHKDRKGHGAAHYAKESGNAQCLETLRAAGLKH